MLVMVMEEQIILLLKKIKKILSFGYLKFYIFELL